MNDYIEFFEIDASPQSYSVNQNQNVIINIPQREKKHSKKTMETFMSVLDEFTIDDYRSIFFLLLDPKEFLSVIKKDKSFLRERFRKLFVEELTEEILLEVLGTMKMYRKLKLFDTCHHLFKQGKYFNDEISGIRKILYSLCEEITNDDLNILKQHLPLDIRENIVCAEEWFAHALRQKIITDSDITKLKQIFRDTNPEFLKIIDSYKGDPDIKSYSIKPTTVDRDCGLSVIFNFTTFKDPKFKERIGSNVDVASLKRMWNTFGFKTIVHNNLTSSELQKELVKYAEMNHEDYDIFVGCFLSHGDSGVIYTHDGIPMPISFLLAIITENCKTLEGKPKLFFIQACQGSRPVSSPTSPGVQPVYRNSTFSEPDSSPEVLDEYRSVFPTLRDVFLVKSTVDGYISWLSPSEGGIFIQALCKVMMEFGDKLSMDDIMIKVTESLSKQALSVIQIVPTYKTLRKKLQLQKRTGIQQGKK